ncbi:MAG: hydroxymethylglutaryl-CoA reductase, degradative [Sandaracinaceae bacterium]|nr:hydroxymethylglutaryl-CoA reductase, degradative [Sandaracinaceae bacterium]
MTYSSELSGFYKLSLGARRERLAELLGLDAGDLAPLAGDRGLRDLQADQMVENAVGILGMPLGVCANMRVDGRDYLVPMAVEEPSVIAASSHAAKMLRAGGGVLSRATDPLVVGQMQILDVPDPAGAMEAVRAATADLLALADSRHHSLIAAGGGARALEVRMLPRIAPDDPVGDMMLVELVVDVRDAMGANAINSMCERLAPRIAELTGGRVNLRILSNLTDRRLVTVEGRVPFAHLVDKAQGGKSGESLARRIEEASVFAERDPYRAATHNKGIMNGVDAVLLALGQDFRAIEAGAHAYAARHGRYTAMATWRVENEHLVGRMTLPMAVGTVGGIVKVHPVVQINRRISRIESAREMAAVIAAVGLAQNLGALRALAGEGIQSGHMRLHARNVAVEAGAHADEVAEVARVIADAGDVHLDAARRALTALRARHAEPRKLPALRAIREGEIESVARPPRPARPPLPPTYRPTAPPTTYPQTSTRGEREVTRIRMSDDTIRPFQAARAGDGPNPERTFRGRVFVTGASGHLGANLVRRLLDDGQEVRVLLRRESNNAAVDGLDVERVYGDLRDLDAVARAVKGCTTAYHAAAHVSTLEATPALERALFESNVVGTQNLLRAAAHHGLERVVVTGSFSAVGYDLDDPTRPGNETMAHYPFGGVLPYGQTKALVELECWKAALEGLDVVVATSCAILGPHDHKPSRMGFTLVDFAHGKVPAYLPGGFDFVAARDLSEGHVLAMRRGRSGQKYVISTQFLSMDDIMDIFEEVTGRPRPRLKLSPSMMAGVAKVSSFVLDRVAPNVPQRFTPAAVRILSMQRRADTSKARAELGYEPTSIRRAVHEAYADFARRGMVPARAGLVDRVEARPEPRVSAVSSVRSA